MFMLFGFRGGRHGRKFLIARVAIIAVFLVIVFAFHPHGTTLDIVQGVRFVLIAALIGSAIVLRRRERNATAEDQSPPSRDT